MLLQASSTISTTTTPGGGESGAAPTHRRLAATAGGEDLSSLAVVSVGSLRREQADLAIQWQALLKRAKEIERHEADLLALPAPPSATAATNVGTTATTTTTTTTTTAVVPSAMAPDLYSLLYGNYPDGPYGHVSQDREGSDLVEKAPTVSSLSPLLRCQRI